MKSPVWIFAGIALLWSLVPYTLALHPFVHSQTYAVIAIVFMFPLIRMVVSQRKAATALIAPREETIALAGVALTLLAAVLCCLLAPSPVDVAGAPGKTAAIPEHDARLQFPAGAVAPSDTRSLHVDVRLGGGRTLSAGSALPLLVGDILVFLQAKPVVTMTARGLGGEALTITQPTGAVFLSPVLLFATSTEIAGLTLPADVFALPAHNRTVRAFLVTPQAMRDARVARMSGGRSGVLCSVDDANGKPLDRGIGFVPDGLAATLGDVVLRSALGVFPSVRIASVPQPMPMLIGTVAYLFSGGVLIYRRRRDKL